MTLFKQQLLDEKIKSQDAIRNERKKCELEKEALTEKHKGELAVALQTIEQNKEQKKLTEQLHKAELQIVQQQQQSAAAMAADAVDSSELKKKLERAEERNNSLEKLNEMYEEREEALKSNLFTKEEEARQYEMDAGSAKADLEEYKSKYLDKQTYVMTVLEPIITCLRHDFKVDSKKLKTLLTDDQYKCFME